MANKEDLTFAELNTALGGTAVVLDAPNSDIKVSLKAITGDSYTALTNTGVLKAMKKLREAAYDAQQTANEDIETETEQLRTFSPPVNLGYVAAEGGVVTRLQEEYVNPINFNVVTGSNA
jgi:hypothetical protein